MKSSILCLFSLLIFNFQTFSQTISPGHYHTLSICSDQTVRAFGDNSFGCLGNNSSTASWSPVIVSSLTDVVAVSASFENSSFALKSDGTVWAWGYNGFGAFGNGTTTSSPVPVQIMSLNNVVAIDAGGWHTLVLKDDSTVWAMGYNNYGQLGDSTTTDRLTPVQVHALSGIVAIAAGENHSLALKSDGTLWAWGWNATGQVGNGTNTDQHVPVQITSLTDSITAITAGWQHSLALTKNGDVYAFGFNGYGQLGLGNLNDINVPTMITAFTDSVVSVSAGSTHSVVLMRDSTVMTFGYGFSGQLGNGSNTNSSLPVAVMGLTDVVQVYSGWEFCISSRSAGDEWNWGYNGMGNLGDGTNQDAYVPGLAIGLCSVLPTGLEDVKEDGSVFIYPNPCDGLFSIKSVGIADVYVYNVTGELVYYKNKFDGIQQIDLRKLNSGIYYVVVDDKDGRRKGKLMTTD